MTLSSTATNTASVDKVAANNAIIGEVTVERFIPSLNRKNYSLVSSPVCNKSIYTNWQEGGATIPAMVHKLQGLQREMDLMRQVRGHCIYLYL